MAKKKAGIETILVDAIAAGTVEQAKTIQNFVNALVNQKTAAASPATAATTTTKRTSTRKTATETPIVQTTVAVVPAAA